MTDHSILNHGVAKLPFEEEARLVTRVIKFFGAFSPSSIGKAVVARNIAETMGNMNDEQLAAYGIDRQGIAAYAVKSSGLLDD